MPRKKAKEVEASTEETQPMEEEAPEVSTEEAPVVVETPKVEVKAPPVAPPSEVPVSSIPDGRLFEYKGQIYRKRILHRSQRVLADLMVKTRNTYTQIEDAVWLDLDTPVKRK